jgi:hypothetical protein
MPDTPNFAITYPCMGPTVAVADFQVYAADVEAALVAVDAEAQAVTHVPYAFATLASNPALGVETVMTMSSTTSSGVTVGASTFTAVTGGVYTFGAQLGGTTSTLTLTSQRLAVYVNGVFQVACKWRGSNPIDAFGLDGAYSVDLPIAAADVVTFRYLWTGTGALFGPAAGTASMTLLATP